MEYIFQILCGMLYVFGLLFGWNYQETSVYVCIYAFPFLMLVPFVLTSAFGTGVLHLPAGTKENIDHYSVAARGSGYGMCFRGIALLFPQIQHRRIGVRPIQILHELAL